jgi:hypothetical protein
VKLRGVVGVGYFFIIKKKKKKKSENQKKGELFYFWLIRQLLSLGLA